MATTITNLIPTARLHLNEVTPSFWSDAELATIMAAGIRDLWRDIVDLKQEHYLNIDNENVTLQADTDHLSGVPADVHKVYLIEPLDLSTEGSNHGLLFKPYDYNSQEFQLARSRSAIDPTNDTIYYAIQKQGAPVAAPVILVAPQVTSALSISFCYVPTLGEITANSVIPVPGEADNALVAWTVAFARAKEREDRSPDPAWVTIYATEKQHILQSLGLRQYQEPQYTNAIFEQYW